MPGQHGVAQLPAPGQPHQLVAAAGLHRLGCRRHVVLTVNEFATAARVVSQSDLLTALPRSFVPASGLAQALVLRPFPGDLPRIDVGLPWHRRDHHDAAHRWLRQAIRRATQDLFGDATATPTGDDVPRDAALPSNR